MTQPINSSLPQYSLLPDTYAISLTQYGCISLTGEEKEKYLQGQVTCDVNSLAQEKLLNGAHCDAKGKVFSAFRLVQREDALLLLQPQTSIETSLAELKKFGVFAKVEITQPSDISFYAVAGSGAQNALSAILNQVPDTLTPVVQHNTTTIVYLAGAIARYLLIDSNDNLSSTINQLALPTYTHNVWNLLEIKEGFPILSATAINEYVPQMINMQAIKGISFTKGCYLGQETVARMQYLGKNKRALFSLQGTSQAIKAGDIIEKKLGENWRKAGDVLASYISDDNICYVQAVLANDIQEQTELRIKTQESLLTLMPLPYTLSTDAE